jgi:hypothetical protein
MSGAAVRDKSPDASECKACWSVMSWRDYSFFPLPGQCTQRVLHSRARMNQSMNENEKKRPSARVQETWQAEHRIARIAQPVDIERVSEKIQSSEEPAHSGLRFTSP